MMSMISIPQNNHLFLKGVFFDEIETIEDKLLYSNTCTNMETSNVEIKKKISYNKIPASFHSIKTWVEATKSMKLRCWYCESWFIGIPVFIPSYINNTVHGKIYETYGTFCSFGCSYAFLEDYHEFHANHTYWDKLQMLKMLYSCFYNKKIYDFVRSPSKYNTESYGGNMTMVEFKKELKKVNMANLNR